jgi:Tat protein translocase TatB subunit
LGGKEVFLLIFESIGTSELLLVAIVALIFLGPRKLPQIARTIGKMMAEFRSTTNEFKATWEREVNFEEEEKALKLGELEEKPVARVNSILDREEPEAPEIREADPETLEMLRSKAESADDAEPAASEAPAKRNWL